MTTLRAMIALCALLWAGGALAEVAVPALVNRVTDQTGTLSATEKQSLEQQLAAFEQRKGSQIVVLVVPSTQPESIEQFSLRVAEKWQIGRTKVDDGALLVVAKDDRSLRIEVGYGLEGALNDATAERIVSDTIAPYFKQNDFYGGIAAGTAQMMKVIDGEPLPAPARRPSAEDGGLQKLFPLIFVITLLVSEASRAMFGRLPGAVVTGGVVSVLAWFLVSGVVIAMTVGIVAFLFTLMGGLPGRGLGGFGGGLGGGGFGGRGGGFSGGGGSFGGGGASGRW